MKNLDLWSLTTNKIRLYNEEKFCFCHASDDDSFKSVFYLCTHDLIVKSYDHNGDLKWSTDVSSLASKRNKPLSVTYLSLLNNLCVGLENGEIFTVKNERHDTGLAGVFQCGLLAMQWSPDQELLALVTKKFKMILLSCNFNPIYEMCLMDQEFGRKQFITVGWGKKETQFHGSAGKQAAKVKDEVNADSNAIHENYIKITWRGDGFFFAIGYVADGIRRFKIFDREGHLQFTSENQQGLEANLSWRPSGNIIATTQRLADKYVVTFFEKNGLKHGEFDLNVNFTTHVEDIIWNCDSEILCLLCKDIENNTQKLLMYTTGNYHWYLKQTLNFNSEQNICCIFWDCDFESANNKILYVVLEDGEIYSYSWVWNVNHSKGDKINDDAIITVIDGHKLLVTGFRQTVVPPPMAALEIALESSVNSVHFASRHANQNIDSNSFFVILSNNNMVFFEQTQKFPLQYRNTKVMEMKIYKFPLQYHNWFWASSDVLVCTMTDPENSYNLIKFVINGNTLVEKCTFKTPDGVAAIQSHPNNQDMFFVLLKNGTVIEHYIYDDPSPYYSDIRFNIACTRFEVIEIKSNLHFLGLSHKGNLIIDGITAVNDVSSFFVHTHFLLITTLKHILLCVELDIAGISAIMDYLKQSSDHIYERKIERGAKLLIAVPWNTRTVFQMPRGNLEAIQPRPLSLKVIGAYLNELKYNDAFELMRKERINLNLIHDHNPQQFLKNVDVFIDSVNNNAWLNLFLADLENTDVTKSMYSYSYTGKVDKNEQIVKVKIENVCNLIREHIIARSDSDSKVLPLITTYVKKSTEEDLEKALLIIKDLKAQELNGSKLPIGSDEALKYLLYMVDVNNLFNVALGMYDFELVLFISNKSQKDPKEYIPMLNDFNEMDENYKKFSINKHLKRFNRAVECLANCGSSRHDELISFVRYHSLYRHALGIFSSNDEIFKILSDYYALYLKLDKNFTQAGIIYERAKNYEKAIDCYKDALEWELALKLATSWPQKQYKQLCWDLVNMLRNEKRHNEALMILELFYDDKEEAITYAIECGHYKTALRFCEQFGRQHLKHEKLLPVLLEDYKNIEDLIEIKWATYVTQKDRLQLVKQNKKENPIEFSYAAKDSDLYSDVGSTVASSSKRSSSVRSHRSSKNRRKHERKITSLKEGSAYEDVGLIIALHSLVTSSFELRLQVKEVVLALSLMAKEREALTLQTSLEKLLKEMKDTLKEIWTDELVIEATIAHKAASDAPEGSGVIPQGLATLAPHLRIAPVFPELNWRLEGFN